MAYFRAGGGGIPASLKSGMNSVLNKKFGTSTTYPPSDWPADVNLLGPLPVKTASGAIASFSDGADDVPVKSCKVSFTPSGGGGTPSSPVLIQGYTGLTLYQDVFNSIDLGELSWTKSGSIFISNTLTDVKEPEGQSDQPNAIILNNSSYSVVPYTSMASGNMCLTIIWSFSYAHGQVWAKNNSISTADDFKTAIRGTILQYESYANSPKTTTDTFGQTIMGGERDLTTDGMSVTWGYIASYNGETLTGRWVSSMDTYVAGTTPTIGAEVAYELATPTEITGLTAHEINTMLGDNNFYADIGETSVEYRADISLALNQ